MGKARSGLSKRVTVRYGTSYGPLRKTTARHPSLNKTAKQAEEEKARWAAQVASKLLFPLSFYHSFSHLAAVSY